MGNAREASRQQQTLEHRERRARDGRSLDGVTDRDYRYLRARLLCRLPEPQGRVRREVHVTHRLGRGRSMVEVTLTRLSLSEGRRFLGMHLA